MAAILNFIYSRWFFLVPLLLVVLVALLSFNQLISIGVQAIDQTARDNMYQRVEVAINIEQRRLCELLTEYIYWDEAYNKLVSQSDTEWGDGNIGSYMYDDLGISLSFVLHADNRPGMTFVDGKLSDLPLTPVQLAPLIEIVRMQLDHPDPVTIFVKSNDKYYLIAMDAFIPEFDNSPATNGAILGIGKLINQDLVKKIAADYRIPGLTLLPVETKLSNELTIVFNNPVNQALFALGWKEQAPAAEIKQRMLRFMSVGAAILFFLLSVIVYLIDNRYQKQEEKLRQLANFDMLTKLYNRHSFFELAHREIKRAKRNNSSLCLIMLDIDYFKQINDQYGHSVGDKVLQQLTECAQGLLRDTDIFARYGGEEFIILLPNTTLDHGEMTAQRICDFVSNYNLNISSLKIHCTVSIGVAPVVNNCIERSILYADQALYCAKNSGRNRISVFQNEESSLESI